MKNTWMRTIPILIVEMFLTLSVYGQEVTMNFYKTPLKEVLEKVGKQIGYSIIYEKKEVNEAKLITRSFENTSLDVVLSAVLDHTVAFSVENKIITLFPKKNQTQQPTATGSSPIKGRIVNTTGEPLTGAVIRVKGTDVATITNLDGEFSIHASQGNVLVASYLGFITSEINVDQRTAFVFELKEELHNLEEVVVVGYGTQKKANLSGAVASIQASQVQDRVQTDVLSAMQGTVPGITIISRPGKAASINFRGRGNLGDSEPLYVVDGAISDAEFFSNLDPNSIESISFLKDAASASIYGSRAAYGVVLITTKQGSESTLQVSYSGHIGFKAPTYKPNFVNSGNYAELFNEAQYNTNPTGGKFQGYTAEEIGWLRDGSKPDLYPNTDWFDLVIKDWAATTQHSVNFSGGNKKVRYFTGLGYVYDTPNIKNRDRQRYNLNLNITSELTDWLTLKGGVKYIQNKDKVRSGTPNFNEFAIVPSTFVAKQSNGDWGSVESGKVASATFAGGNPLRTYDKNDWSQNDWEHSMYDIGLDIKPLAGLVISGSGIYNNFDRKNKKYVGLQDDVPSYLAPGQVISGTGNAINYMEMEWDNRTKLLLTGTARYDWTKSIHTFGALLGVSYEKNKKQMLGASRENFPIDTNEDMSAGSTVGNKYQNKSSSSEDRMFSYFARINYTLMNRYIVEGNLRADASSRFHEDERWGYFPSFSAAWRVSEEGFMNNTRSWLDNLKVRASYGTLGNINNVSYYDYLSNYLNNKDYSFDNNPVKGLAESRPANKNLTWETVSLTDFGLDFDLFGGKLSGVIDYYIKNTKDILLQYNVPAETGIPQSYAPYQNMGKVRNTGIELALTHRNKVRNVSYSLSANIATNRNRVKVLNSDLLTGDGVVYILRMGQPIGSFYGFKTDGLYTQEDIDAGRYYTYGGTTPNAGDIKYIPQRDIEYKEAITNDDRTIIGKDVPDFTYGLNFNVMYKNIELSVFGQGVSGTKVGFRTYFLHPFFHGQDNPREFHMSRWTEDNPNPNASYPRLYDASNTHTAYNRAFSEYSLFDADYFRFKTITLGYMIPKQITSKVGISTLKFFMTGENLITIRADKKMKDFDPETESGTISSLGFKSFAFGVNITF